MFSMKKVIMVLVAILHTDTRFNYTKIVIVLLTLSLLLYSIILNLVLRDYTFTKFDE